MHQALLQLAVSSPYTDVEGFKEGQRSEISKSVVRRRLEFDAGGSSHNSISPSTPERRPPCGPTKLNDSNDDLSNSPVAKRSKVAEGLAYIETGKSESKSDEVLSSFRHERKTERKWKGTDEMISDFFKSPELCMRAVCALWRKQTPTERALKKTIDRNDEGFNKDDAEIGSKLAEFLTGGDPESDIKKSVEQVLQIFPDGLKQCERMNGNSLQDAAILPYLR